MKLPTALINDFFNHISALGSKEITILIPIFFFLINENLLATKIIIGIIIIYVIGIPIRLLYKKERPYKKPRNNVYEIMEANSFPSMHAARSTLLIIILIQYFQYEIKISLFFLVLYVLNLIARLYKKRHYVIDIICGIILGIIPFIFL